MDINNIIKVKFLKSDETLSGSNIKETLDIFHFDFEIPVDGCIFN